MQAEGISGIGPGPERARRRRHRRPCAVRLDRRRAIRRQLIVGGYVMVGAILTNASPVSLADVTPIARLTGEAEAIVVPAASPIQNIDDLVEKMKADPGSVSWAGGSAGGADHITVGLLAKAAGVDPTKINYVAFSGGGEALAAILGNQVTVGISGVGEFLPQVEAGTMRLLAVSTGRAVAGHRCADADGSRAMTSIVQNWRMVAAAPGLTRRTEGRRHRRHRQAGELGRLEEDAGRPRAGPTPTLPAPTSTRSSPRTSRRRPPS